MNSAWDWASNSIAALDGTNATNSPCCNSSGARTDTKAALISKISREHAAGMEKAADVLSKEERIMLVQILTKLGKGEGQELPPPPADEDTYRSMTEFKLQLRV